MKTTILISLLTVCSLVNSFGQTYDANKTKFDYNQYTYSETDRYDPLLAGICSFFVPGLGQVISNEPLRGIGYFGGFVGCSLVSVLGVGVLATPGFFGPDLGLAALLITGGIVGMIAVDVCSVVDAVRVAKVNNLYIRSLNKSNIDIKLTPFVQPITLNNQTSVPVGVSLKVTF